MAAGTLYHAGVVLRYEADFARGRARRKRGGDSSYLKDPVDGCRISSRNCSKCVCIDFVYFNLQ
jgi:hypothetical protein